MPDCPYCGAHADDAQAEIAHMNSVHADIVEDRLRKAGMHDEANKVKIADLTLIKHLVDDLIFYRSIPDDGGLAEAAWIELYFAVEELPERPRGFQD